MKVGHQGGGRQGLLGSLEWLDVLLISQQQSESCLHVYVLR